MEKNETPAQGSIGNREPGENRDLAALYQDHSDELLTSTKAMLLEACESGKLTNAALEHCVQAIADIMREQQRRAAA